MNIHEAMKRATPGPWWGESGVAHAKGPEWTEENHSCVHPIANQNGTEFDEPVATHWFNHGPKLLEALHRAEDRLYKLEHKALAHELTGIRLRASEVEGLQSEPERKQETEPDPQTEGTTNDGPNTDATDKGTAPVSAGTD